MSEQSLVALLWEKWQQSLSAELYFSPPLPSLPCPTSSLQVKQSIVFALLSSSWIVGGFIINAVNCFTTAATSPNSISIRYVVWSNNELANKKSFDNPIPFPAPYTYDPNESHLKQGFRQNVSLNNCLYINYGKKSGRWTVPYNLPYQYTGEHWSSRPSPSCP